MRQVFNSFKNSGLKEKRRFEFAIHYDNDGGLILEWLNLPLVNFKEFTGSLVGFYGSQIFEGKNFNLSENVLSKSKTELKIVCYSNKDILFSIYPAGCFEKITRDSFAEEVCRIFNILRERHPNEFGAITPKDKKSLNTTGESKMNIDFNKLGKDIVSDNLQFAKFEAERKIGQAALDVSIDAFCKQFPSFKQTADTNIGKLAIANLVRILGNQYKGANKEAVDTFTSAVMRGSYATVGDSIDLDMMFDGLIDKFKNIIPTGLISEKTETSEPSAK